MIINDHVINALLVRTDISQRSFVLFILYLFYNADLLNICEKFEIKINEMRFVDDVNILTYDNNIEKNCRTLKIVHKKCEK